MEIKLGKYNTLRVVKEVDFGLYLDGGVEGEILLPKRYVPQGCKPGDELEVFIYLDQEERLVATTQKPLAQVGEFACLEVSWVLLFSNPKLKLTDEEFKAVAEAIRAVL